MRMGLKKLAASVAAGAAIAMAVPATAAFATNEVGCDGRDDFVRVRFHVGEFFGSERCWANSGTVAVDVYDAYDVSAGNNSITFAYESNGLYYAVSLGPWSGIGFPEPGVHVYQIWVN